MLGGVIHADAPSPRMHGPAAETGPANWSSTFANSVTNEQSLVLNLPRHQHRALPALDTKVNVAAGHQRIAAQHLCTDRILPLCLLLCCPPLCLCCSLGPDALQLSFQLGLIIRVIVLHRRDATRHTPAHYANDC